MKNRRTKIIATLGPASSTPSMMKALAEAGADVFRLNFSHGTHPEHLKIIRQVRELSAQLKRPIGILADLPGPKLRTGPLKGGVPVYLANKKICTLTTRAIHGTAEMIPVAYQKLPQVVERGDRILLADGLLELRVLRTSGKEITCRIMVGGELGEHKGINLPGRHLAIPALTFRDREAMSLLSHTEVDYIALSFVQRPEDIEIARKWMRKAGKIVPIIAKIEKPEAVEQIESILRVADGIMIARGDLGVEVPTAEIPVVQKELIHLASKRSVPVITATQMLDSMIHNPRPTRAETTDVANAIWDGTDAVMLSGETATGRYPVETVRVMSQIIEKAEGNPEFQWVPPPIEIHTDSLAVLKAATAICKPKVHKALVTYTETGNTAIALSKLRPPVPVLALTPVMNTYYRLSLTWGVRAFFSKRGKSVDEMIYHGDMILMKQAGLKKGDRIIVVAGTRLTSGATNLLKVHQIGETLSGASRRK